MRHFFFPQFKVWVYGESVLRKRGKECVTIFLSIFLSFYLCRESIILTRCRVSTKWLNLLHKICAIFAQIFFCKLLRMKRNEFCTIFFAQFAQNRKYFLRKLRMKGNFSFAQFFAQFAQKHKFYAKCNFIGKLSKNDILSLELNNWRFISYIKKKKILTYEYDNDYTTLNWLRPVTKSLN